MYDFIAGHIPQIFAGMCLSFGAVMLFVTLEQKFKAGRTA